MKMQLVQAVWQLDCWELGLHWAWKELKAMANAHIGQLRSLLELAHCALPSCSEEGGLGNSTKEKIFSMK
jgi:hypothetical protein